LNSNSIPNADPVHDPKGAKIKGGKCN
jgi:hypothetical protein